MRTFERIVEGKMVEEQEGIEFVADPRRNRAAQLDARAFDGSLRFDNSGDSSKVVHVRIDAFSQRVITRRGRAPPDFAPIPQALPGKRG